MKLKPITSTSWIVLENDKKSGLLSYINEQYTLIISGKKQIFSTRDEVIEYFKEDVFENTIEEIKVESTDHIKGYPVDFNNPIEVENSLYPVYRKTNKSETYYAAGYYCIKFPTSWVQSFCPKLATLSKNEVRGPFRSLLEMKSVLKSLR